MPGVDKSGAWGDHFVGRQYEVQFLRRVYERANGRGRKNPGAEIVVLTGDSGWGKTRIVQRFYEELAATQTGDYWPPKIGQAARTLLVNPVFTEHHVSGDSVMPFLWWGIRAPNLSKRNTYHTSITEAYLPALLPHLESVKRAQRSKAALIKAGKIALNLASLGFSDNLDNVKTLIEIGFDILKTDDAEDGGTVTKKIDKEKLSLREKIHKTFLQLMKLNKGEKTVPIIVFLDDAQFVDVDQNLIELLFDLLNLAEARRYPLLLIICHWESDWAYQLENSFQTRRGNPGITRLVFAPQTPWSSSWAATQKPENILVIKELDEIDELIGLTAPGLPESDVDLLLHKVDGNPLILEQVYFRYLRYQDYFRDNRSEGGFTEAAIKTIKGKSFELHDLIEDRLTEPAQEDVRWVLSLASLQGSSFSQSLLFKTLPDSEHPRAGGALRAAESTERLIDRMREDVYEFNQTAVHEVALKISEGLGYHSHYLSTLKEQCVTLTDGKLDLPAIGYIWRLSPILSRILDEDPDAKERRALLVIYGHVCVDCYFADDAHRAASASRRFIELIPNSYLLPNDLDLSLVHYASEIRFRLGDIEGCQLLIKSVLKEGTHFYNSIDVFSGKPTYDALLNRLAEVSRLYEDYEQARMLGELAVERARSYAGDVTDHAARADETADRRFILNRALLLAGRVAQDQDNIPEARRYFEAAVRLNFKEVADGIYETISAEGGLIALTDLSDTYKHEDNYQAAYDILKAALRAGQMLWAEKQTPNADRLNLLVLSRLARAALQIGKADVASEAKERALNLATGLAESLNTHQSFFDLADCYLIEAEIILHTQPDSNLTQTRQNFFRAMGSGAEALRAIAVLHKLQSFLFANEHRLSEEDVQTLWNPTFDIAQRVFVMLKSSIGGEVKDKALAESVRSLTAHFYNGIRLGKVEPSDEYVSFTETYYNFAKQRYESTPSPDTAEILFYVTECTTVPVYLELDWARYVEKLRLAARVADMLIKQRSSVDALDYKVVFMERLGVYHEKKNDLLAARDCYEEALALRKKYYQENSFSVAVLANLAKSYECYCRIICHLEQLDRFFEIHRECVAAFSQERTDMSDAAEETIDYLFHNLTLVWYAPLGKYSEHESFGPEYWKPLVEIIRAIETKSGQRPSDFLLVALINFAIAHSRIGDMEAAHSICRTAHTELEARRSAIGDERRRRLENDIDEILSDDGSE